MDKPFKYTHEFGLKAIDKHLKSLISEVDGVKNAEDPESVHRMRVAARRLRTSLSVFEDCFPSSKAEKFRRKIRALAGVLGEARDMDVRLGFLKAFYESVQDRKFIDGIKRLLLRTDQKRKSLQPDIIRVIERIQKEKLFNEISKAIKNSTRIKSNGPSLTQKAFDEVSWRLEDVMNYSEVVRLPDNIGELHDLRIAVKHLRYCLEIFCKEIDGLDDYVVKTKALQDILGDIHDCDVWIEYIPEFLELEERRTYEYCGSNAPMARIKPGIIFLGEDRNRFRNIRYKDFMDYWDSCSAEFSKLKSMMSKGKDVSK